MRIHIATVDGAVTHSTEFTLEEVQGEIDESGGEAFSGDLAHKNRPGLKAQEALDEIMKMLEYRPKDDYQTFSMETDEGRVKFNVRHVVRWWMS